MRISSTLLALWLTVPAGAVAQPADPAHSGHGAGPGGSQAMAVTPAPVRRPARTAEPAGTAPSLPDTSAELRAGFTAALGARRFDDAQRYAEALLAGDKGSVALLDELTYKLVDAGAADQAARTLLRAYPFAGGAAAERDTLFQRLIVLIVELRTVLHADQLQALRDPLDTPALRSRQAALWTALQQCATTRAVLSDMSPAYGHDDWMRLGDCSAVEAPELARQAYARAHTLQPGGRASRALAYQAHAAQDYRTALGAWRTVDVERLSGDELLAAATTALAASEHEQAASWLASFLARGLTPDHAYWSLAGQAYTGRDTAAAVAALERAVQLRPSAGDYLRLARLETDTARQVRWLERAAELEDDAHTAAELGFAYVRAGRPASGLLAFERAAALDPNNMTVQIELGYAYWGAGRAAAAREAFERALQADPGNLTLAQQLVYVYQRLKLNDTARRYVKQVLDAPAAFSETSAGSDSGGTAAERRFGFQRLHEDLGRRVTINLDGWSGTAVGVAAQAPQAGNRYRSYSQLEADVRLGSPPIRNGSTLSAYGRVLADGGELRSALPSQNAMLGVGLRWKPFGSRIVYLAAEHQNGLDDVPRRDVLLRASASFLNGRRSGDDWQPSRTGWFSRNLYLDAAQYLRTRQTAFTADYRTSYHRRVSSSGTLEPYVHLQVNSTRTSRVDRDIRTGLGVRWNVWYGGNRYDAAPHKLSIGLEFQQALDTYLADRNGLFVSLGTRW